MSKEAVKIITRDTPEKFWPLAEEIVPPLLALLRERNELERDICARSIKLREEKAAAGLSLNLTTPAEKELWDEYAGRYLELVRPQCLPSLLKYGAAGSFGKPAQYDYLFEAEEPRVFFIMKSTKRAVVETIARKSTDTRYRFVLRPTEDGWKVGGVEYTFGNNEDWHADHHV